MIESLQYPFEIQTILRKKKSLKKQLLQQDDFTEKNIAILGGSTTSEIKNILELFLLNSGIKPNFYESEYNKFYEDALFGAEKLDDFNPDIIYIHTSNMNIINYPSMKDSAEDVTVLLNNEMDRYEAVWNGLSKYNCAVIQNNFDLPYNRALGNLGFSDIHGKTNFIHKLNALFAESANKINNLYINDINYLSAYIGIENWFDKRLWHMAKYAVSFDAIPHLAHNISSIISAIFGLTKKCVVLDLDNTCWGGVIGDDGIGGIQLGTETANGESYSAFQAYIKELKERGVVLAVCSKNDPENAKEGFSHSGSILELDDFTSFKANWNLKYQNILEIAQEINIGKDSLVFIDDNPVEREAVASNLPEVAVPDVGNDVTAFADYIDRSGFFELASLSSDDIQRNRYYEDNQKRKQEVSAFTDYNDFLLSLEMTAEIEPFTPICLDRITQLINKTNQFNLTTKRYNAGEVENIASNDNYITQYGKLTDKFGENGIIAITIGSIKGNQCHIDLWLMSCRVLQRDMEFAMLDSLVEQCKKKGITELVGYYYKSAKNSMVADLYKKFGFDLVEKKKDSSIWKLSIEDYTDKNKIIRVKHD